MIRLGLTDDHPVVRAGLRAVLETEPDFEVVAEASSVDQAVAAAPSVDVMLMDLNLGAGGNGAAATRAISALPNPPRVLILTTYDSEVDILTALEAGASGYLLKDAPPEELAAAIRSASKGQSALAPAIASRLVTRMQAPSTALSARELEVLQALARGLTNQEMAAHLYVSVATIKTHLVHIFDKLGVDSRTAALAEAKQRGLLR